MGCYIRAVRSLFFHFLIPFLSLHFFGEQKLSSLSNPSLSSPVGPTVVGGGQARRPAVIDGGAAAKNSFFFIIFFAVSTSSSSPLSFPTLKTFKASIYKPRSKNEKILPLNRFEQKWRRYCCRVFAKVGVGNFVAGFRSVSVFQSRICVEVQQPWQLVSVTVIGLWISDCVKLGDGNCCRFCVVVVLLRQCWFWFESLCLLFCEVRFSSFFLFVFAGIYRERLWPRVCCRKSAF